MAVSTGAAQRQTALAYRNDGNAHIAYALRIRHAAVSAICRNVCATSAVRRRRLINYGSLFVILSTGEVGVGLLCTVPSNANVDLNGINVDFLTTAPDCCKHDLDNDVTETRAQYRESISITKPHTKAFSQTY